MPMDLSTSVLDAGLAAIRRWPSERARAWVERFVCDAAENPCVVAIVAYGSTVRDAGESEDVDLLYVHLGAEVAADERAARARKAATGLAADGDPEAARELERSAVTQQARARLIRSGIFPLSRPELPGQLVAVGDLPLAAELSALLADRR